EIRTRARAQVDEGGVAALSLNAIAKAMGVSGPALYRYFASRDDLLAALITEGYADITATVQQAAADATRRAPARRLQAVADAYRAWALAHPRRYAMLFGDRPEGFADPAEAIAEIQGAMETLLAILAEIAGPAGARSAPARPTKLDQQLTQWAERRGEPAAPAPLILRLGVLTWTRLHGTVSLELAGVFGDMGLDAGLLLEAEIAQIVEAATT
ncbi:MAG TPA: TetR/AcrR family transcriptional regulator, partial [Baekduia sp.]